MGMDASVIADHPAFVFGAYLSALAPLAIIYALDLVSEKWKSVKDTRRAGYFILLFSIPSLFFLFIYIHFQRRASDYKEMAAATSAAVYAVLHLSRTIWGLIQLSAFQKWNENALLRLKWLGYDVLGYKETTKKQNRRCRDSCTFKHKESSEYFEGNMEEKYHETQSESVGTSAEAVRNVRFASSEEESTAESISSSLSGSFHQRTTQLLRRAKRRVSRFRKAGMNIFCYERKVEDSICENCQILGQAEDTINNEMVVNSSLIDNEFAHAELPCQLDFWPFIEEVRKQKMKIWNIWVSDFLKCKFPEECTVQWIVAFLSRFGSAWLIDSKNTKAQQDLAILSALHVTHQVPVDTKDIETRYEHESVLPPGHSFSVNRREIQSSSLEINQEVRDALPYKMRAGREIKRMDFAAYESNIRDAIASWHTVSVNKLEKKEREAVSKIEPYQAAMFAKLISGNSRNKISLEKIDDDVVPDFAFQNFNMQLGNRHTVSKNILEYLPFRKEFASVLLWNGDSRNRFLLQGSVHIDNWLALEIGHKQKILFSTTTRAFRIRPCASDIITFQKELELHRLQNDLATAINVEQIYSFHQSRFLGCVIESVRSLLARWIYEYDSNSNEIDQWSPWLSSNKMEFFCSQQLCDALKKQASGQVPCSAEESRNIDMRILWEIQSFLHEKISNLINQGDEIESMPRCTYIIMLFILGFPSIIVQKVPYAPESSSDEDTSSLEMKDIHAFRISAVEGPQNINIHLNCDPMTGASQIYLLSESETTPFQFKWQDWKDAFNGRILAQTEWRESKLFFKNEKFRKETVCARISDPVITVYKKSLHLDFDLAYWSGWPPFLCNISRFEVRASDELRLFESYEMILENAQNIAERLETAMDILRDSGKVRESGHSLYSEAGVVREAGNKKQWEVILLRCISEYAHSDALDDAVSHVFGGGALDKSSLLSAIYDGIGVYLKQRPRDSIVSYKLFDLEKVAEYCSQIYHLPSGNPETLALFLKGLAYFYCKQFHEGIDERCIDAFESGLFHRSDCSFYLAMSYYRLHQMNGNVEYKNMASKFVRSYKSDGIFKTSMAYLLERGSFSGKHCKRLRDLCDYFKSWIDADYLKDLFYFLFLEPGALGILKRSPSTEQFISSHQCSDEISSAYGIYQDTSRAVKMYKTAIKMYKSMSLRDFLEDQNPCNFGGDASNRLAMMYHRGLENCHEPYSGRLKALSSTEPATKAEKLYLEAIEMSNVDAVCNLGVLYMEYSDGAQNVFRAAEKLEHAIDKLCTTAMNNMAILLENGKIGRNDSRRSKELYEKAIRVDKNPIAEYNFGVFLKFGDESFRNIRRGNMLLDDIIRRDDISHLPILTAQASAARERVIEATESVEDLPTLIDEVQDCLGYIKIVNELG